MQSLRSLLEDSGFSKPDLTPEQWAANDAEVAAMEEERERARFERRLEEAGIPLGYRDAEVSEPAVAAWAAEPTKGLLIQGGVGRGKTHNACAALRLMLHDRTARFATFDDLLRECRATYSNRDTEEAVIGRYANTGVLCIDDMGKERVTEWSLPIIFAIINKRGMNLKPTIITTQYSGKQLVERLTVDGDAETARAIVSRLSEYSRVLIEGRDWRRAE